MASAGSIVFELAADVSRLRTDLGKAAKEMTSALDAIKKSTAATAVMTGAEYAMNFAKGFADKITAAIDQADAMGKLAQRIGTSTEAISGLNYAAGFAGVSLDDLTTSFKGLNKALLDSRDPASDAAAAFKALGLNAAQLRAMDPSEAFNKIATSMSGFKDGAEKAAVATALFGKQGQALIPLLNQGAEGIAKATEEARKMGLIVSDETAAAMGDLNDDIERFHKQSEGAAAILARELQPAFHEVIEAMKEAQTEGTTWNTVLTGIAIVAKAVIGTLVGIAGTVTALGQLIMGFARALNQPISAEGFKNAGKAIADSQTAAQKTIAGTEERIAKIVHIQTAAEKEAAALSNAWGIVAKRAEASGKATLNYSGELDKNAAMHKKAKKEVDEYANMLEKLQEEYRKTAAEGDAMKELVTDPKYQAMTEDQQANLRAWITANIDLKNAIAARAEVQENAANDDARQAEDAAARWRAEEDHAKSVWDWAEQQRRAVDPMIEYNEQVDLLNEALKEGAIPTTEEYLAILQKINDTYDQSVDKTDPYLQKMEELEKAIEGFGKKSSDAFVDFIFATKDASVSFGEMVTSILKDMAKMLVYQNVFKPIFSGISKGATDLDWGSLFRQSGGPVSKGEVYRINEIPGRAEYFIPNVPGKIVTDANAGIGGGANVTVNVHMSKDDRATQDTTASDRQAAELGNRIATVVRSVISQEKRTGGLLASPR
ncbi:hypothetical protein CR51_27195 [Caballeronia megalochromosomata]|nr:hypothetical protein CR51_27195 [Caballeronia megalochromosomata]